METLSINTVAPNHYSGDNSEYSSSAIKKVKFMLTLQLGVVPNMFEWHLIA